MKILRITVCFLFCIQSLISQELRYTEIAPPTIRSSGYAERYVEPDRIFIDVVIDEDLIKSRKETLDETESAMMSNLIHAGIKRENVRLIHADMIYMNINWFKNHRSNQRHYTIEVQSTQELNTVYDVLNGLQVNSASVVKFEYSQADSLISVLRIEAAKQAKQKAEELVLAVGAQLGDLMSITEGHGDHVHIRGARTGQTNYYLDGVRVVNSTDQKEVSARQSVEQVTQLHFSQSLYLTYLLN